MRKLFMKLAVASLSCVMLCSVAGFSTFKDPGINTNDHVCCSCAAHDCTRYTARRYGAWEDCNTAKDMSQGRYLRKRKVETVCLTCGKVVGSYYERQERYYVPEFLVITGWKYYTE